MSFRGELREFELPDILQLIASQQKAGWLKIISRGRCHFVFFRDGKITSTKNPSEETDPFEEWIARRGLLSEEQADRIAAARRKTGLDVPDLLRKEGLMSAEDVQEIFDAMVEQDIFELMTIKSGTYEFETEERPAPLPEGALCAEIGPILMESARKADEVLEMRRALGPEDGVLALSGAGREAEPELPEERAILALVNGVRPIDAILEESGLDRYTATRALFDCARNGWVALTKARGRSDASAGVEEDFDAGRAVRWLAPVVALLAAAVLFSDALGRFRRDDALLGEWLQRRTHREAVESQERVRMALEVYRVRHGRYPATLEALAEDGLVSGGEIRGTAGSRWTYRAPGANGELTLAPAPPAGS